MPDELLIDQVPGETRAALVSDGRLVELVLSRETAPSQVGNIYLGKVARVVPGIAGAFVDCGEPRFGVLAKRRRSPGEDGPPSLCEGQAVVVQVTRDSVAEKGPSLTRSITIAGRNLVLTPGQPGITVSRRIGDQAVQERLRKLASRFDQGAEGFILRAAAACAADETVLREARYLRAEWREIDAAKDSAQAPALLRRDSGAAERALRDLGHENVSRIGFDDAGAFAAAKRYCMAFMPHMADRLALHQGDGALFDRYDLDGEIAALADKFVDLPSGGRLTIQPTRGPCVIDVDSARASEGGSKGGVVLKTNLEAAVEVARQLRLRGIGGLVVIDFIDMASRADWRKVTNALLAAVQADRAPIRLFGVTKAGLVELSRGRSTRPIAELLTDERGVWTAESAAFDALRALKREARRGPGRALRVAAAPAVIAVLRGGQPSLAERMAAAIGCPVSLQEAPSAALARFDITLVRKHD